jgi:hypothetical protein
MDFVYAFFLKHGRGMLLAMPFLLVYILLCHLSVNGQQNPTHGVMLVPQILINNNISGDVSLMYYATTSAYNIVAVHDEHSRFNVLAANETTKTTPSSTLRFVAQPIDKYLFEYVDNLPIPQVPECSAKVHNILYIKTHKAASETMVIMFRRFGLRHNLSFALPVGFKKSRNNLGWPQPFKADFVYPSVTGKFNILCDHSVFNPAEQESILPKNKITLTSIREPYAHLRSAFYYFRMAKHIHMKQKDNLHEFLLDLDSYDRMYKKITTGCVPCGVSVTNNAQALDLGFPMGLSHGIRKTNNNTFIMDFIKMISQKINIPIVVEYFLESMVFMKRKLCWTHKDVLYLVKNQNKQNTSLYAASYEQVLLNNARQWNHIDTLLYTLFNRTLWYHIDQMGRGDFMAEVAYFKELLVAVIQLCNGNPITSAKNMHNFTVIKSFEESKWGDGFGLTYGDCYALQTNLRKEVSASYNLNSHGYYDKKTSHKKHRIPGC